MHLTKAEESQLVLHLIGTNVMWNIGSSDIFMLGLKCLGC